MAGNAPVDHFKTHQFTCNTGGFLFFQYLLCGKINRFGQLGDPAEAGDRANAEGAPPPRQEQQHDEHDDEDHRDDHRLIQPVEHQGETVEEGRVHAVDARVEPVEPERGDELGREAEPEGQREEDDGPDDPVARDAEQGGVHTPTLRDPGCEEGQAGAARRWSAGSRRRNGDKGFRHSAPDPRPFDDRTG